MLNPKEHRSRLKKQQGRTAAYARWGHPLIRAAHKFAMRMLCEDWRKYSNDPDMFIHFAGQLHPAMCAWLTLAGYDHESMICPFCQTERQPI